MAHDTTCLSQHPQVASAPQRSPSSDSSASAPASVAAAVTPGSGRPEGSDGTCMRIERLAGSSMRADIDCRRTAAGGNTIREYPLAFAVYSSAIDSRLPCGGCRVVWSGAGSESSCSAPAPCLGPRIPACAADTRRSCGGPATPEVRPSPAPVESQRHGSAPAVEGRAAPAASPGRSHCSKLKRALRGRSA